MIEIITEKVDSETENSVKSPAIYGIIRYAWGNSRLKTWFITKTKKEFLQKGCKLLFKITGEQTSEPIKTSDTYPKQGDVISDVNGSKIKVIDVSWI